MKRVWLQKTMKKLHEIIAPLEEWEEQEELQDESEEGTGILTQTETAGSGETQDKDQLRHVLIELLVGIAVLGITWELIGVWFVKDKLGYCVGLLIGALLAAAMAMHMARSLDRALELPQADAQKKIRTNSICRYLIIVVVLGVVMYTGIANPLAAFLGIMSLKVAAYLQPFTHKYLQKIYKNEEEPS